MPQPHITDETYKGLTPDEQEKYGEEVWEWCDIVLNTWNEAKYRTSSDYELWSRIMNYTHHTPTRSVHYLKPVEAQQSEGEGFDGPYQDLFTHMYRDHNLILLESEMSDMIEAAKPLWQGEITALQQEVERLKEAQRWIPVTITPKHDKFYQLAFNEDMYLKFYQWHMLDLSNRPTPCFISCSGNDIMEKHEVTHYREIHTDPPEWATLTTSTH